MSSDLRNVPNLDDTNKLAQTRFWGGEARGACIQVTQLKPKGEGPGTSALFNHLSLTQHQARMLATELMLFAEGREVEDREFSWSAEEV